MVHQHIINRVKKFESNYKLLHHDCFLIFNLYQGISNNTILTWKIN